jgi:hypothetical protein
LRHAVKADVDLANFAGLYRFIEPAGFKIALTHAACGKRQLLERAVDEPGNQRCTRQRQHGGHAQPDQPGLAARRVEAVLVGLQPIVIAAMTNPIHKPACH